jgi:hypothetical protein
MTRARFFVKMRLQFIASQFLGDWSRNEACVEGRRI